MSDIKGYNDSKMFSIWNREGLTMPPDLSNTFLLKPVSRTSIDNNYQMINALYSGFNTSQTQLINNYKDISNNVHTYLSKRDYLQENNAKYHYDDMDDPNVILRPEESKDIKTAIKNDILEMRLYQNSIYITTAIACVTLIIGTLILTKK
jgi:subtilase family serine protease